MVEQITLYTARGSPYGQRVEIALAEAGAEFTKYEIDLKNKPGWFASKINPAGMVPAIAYGGPQVLPDQPSPESAKISESLVLVEFIADLFPESKLLPKDPVLRAKVRFFNDTTTTKLFPAFVGFFFRGESINTFLDGLESIQQLLPEGKTFAISDDFTITDAAIAPFLLTILVCLKNDIGLQVPGVVKEAYEALNSPRFSKLLQYGKAVESRDSLKKTFDEGYIKDYFRKRVEQ